MSSLRVSWFASFLLLATATAAAADGYPSRPARLAVPFSDGGAVVAGARTLAHRLPQQLSQKEVV